MCVHECQLKLIGAGDEQLTRGAVEISQHESLWVQLWVMENGQAAGNAFVYKMINLTTLDLGVAKMHSATISLNVCNTNPN